MQIAPVSFDSPTTLWAALAIAAIGIAVALYRRPMLPLLSALLGAAGMLLLAIAAGGPSWRGSRGGEVVVMVDLSPSTRAAHYRDAAALRERVRQLIGDAPHRVVYFPAGDRGTGARLPDVPVARTEFIPRAAPAVLLFSDVRFELPAAAPPTHIVVDPELEDPPDAVVERMEAANGTFVVTARNTGLPRPIILTVPPAVAEWTVPAGGAVITRPVPPGATSVVTARLAPGDAWPENDVVSLALPPPAEAQRWWVGEAVAGGGWRSMRPQDMPADPAAYLAPAVIVMDNVAADELTEAQQRRLHEYVRDLGGGLVILGGDRAFAAGGYAGTSLDRLSPLASFPPDPAAHWVFLIDSSGSMNGATNGAASRWRAAVDAVAKALAALPPGDLLSVGGFAGDIEWWCRAKPAGATPPDAFPPPGARAAGPTELRRALEAGLAAAGAASGATGGRTELVLLTDANAPLEAPTALLETMRRSNVRLHLLDIAESTAPGLPALRQVVEATGGSLLREAAPAAWARAVRRLTRAAAPDLLVTQPARLTFTGPLGDAPPRTVAPPWNHVWLKPQASQAAEATANGARRTAAAVWRAGEGRVLAAAFRAGAADVAPFLRLVERPPRDPRLRVVWDAGARLRVSIDAVESGASGDTGPLNGLDLALEVSQPGDARDGNRSTMTPIPQIAPGRYELTVDAPLVPSFAAIRHGGKIVDRTAVAGRYPPEYEQTGNDRRAMRELAARTGGSVIEPADRRRVPLPVIFRGIPLTSWFAGASAALASLALVRWRLGPSESITFPGFWRGAPRNRDS
jgi:hypothetical protein